MSQLPGMPPASPKRRPSILRSMVLRYTLAGFLFGATFPLVSGYILALENGLSLRFENFDQIHRLSKIQWIIDTAPLFLGFFAFLVGRAQERANRFSDQLSDQLNTRLQLVERLQESEKGLKISVDRRVVQLRTAAQVAQQTTLIRDQTTLLNKIVHLISEQFDFYHVGVFLNDPTNEFAGLFAANSAGGQRMLARKHRLTIGETGLVGYVADRGVPRIALDVGKDAVFFNNPDLPETRSEIALPLKRGERVIGVLDVQSTKPEAFDENDIITLQIIADSLSSAIENATLFEQIQSNMKEIQALNRQYLMRAWESAISRLGSSSYTYNAPRTQTGESASSSRKIEVPILLRDQVIGTITLEAAPRAESGFAPDEWTTEEKALINSAVNRASLALENARLLEETRLRAAQERIVSNVSSRVWATNDIETILRTTLQELSNSLRATEGIIQLSTSITPMNVEIGE